jgi:hypothetical protein
MKTNEQNQKEVIGYLEKSSTHFFESEDGLHYQAIIKIESTGEFVFIKDSVVFKINISSYTSNGETAGKAWLKNRYFTKMVDTTYHKDYGHGKNLKMRAVRKRTKARLELIKSALESYVK